MLILFILIYFAITLAIGFYANARISGGRDFINAGRNLHPIVNAFALFALWFGSETLFGASAEFAEKGIPGIIEDPLGAILCLLLVGVFYARKMYRLNVLTLGDLFHLQFGRRIEIFASALMTISFIGYIAAQLLALGLILELLTSWSLFFCMAAALVIVLLYTTSGGMLAVSLTDFFQSLMIIIGLILIAWYITPPDTSPLQWVESLPDGHLKFFPDHQFVEWLNWMAAWMALGLGSIVSQDVFQRVNAARSEKSASSSSISGALLYAVFSLLPIYIVWTIYERFALANHELQMSLPKLVLSEMPVALQIFFFGSVISAILSTCSGAILAPASLLAENIIKPMLSKELKDRQLLVLTRICTVVMGLSGLWVASGSERIFDLVGTSSAFGVVSIFLPYTMALFRRSSNQWSAGLSMTLGSLTWSWFYFVMETPVNPTIYGLLASIGGWWIGSFFNTDKNMTVKSKN